MELSISASETKCASSGDDWRRKYGEDAHRVPLPSACIWRLLLSAHCKKAAHTRLPSVGFQSWSWFLAVSLQVTWVINPTVGCHYFPPGPQLPSQPLTRLLPVLLLGEQRHDGCEQFAQDCYQTTSRLRFEPKPFCAWVQHANHSATESPLTVSNYKSSPHS